MSVPYRLQPSPFVVPPCNTEIELLDVREHWLLVIKPSGLLSVPGRDPRNHDSVQNRLTARFADARIVHRLDLETSGIMLLARGQAATRAFGRLFQQRKMAKRYVAVAAGRVHGTHGLIDLPLICDWPHRPRQMVDVRHGKPAATHWTVLKHCDANPTLGLPHTRLGLTPHTGRSHQLRVHCQALGHPLLGDPLYAPDAACRAAPRLLLHAERLAFTCPFTREPITAVAPVPF